MACKLLYGKKEEYLRFLPIRGYAKRGLGCVLRTSLDGTGTPDLHNQNTKELVNNQGVEW